MSDLGEYPEAAYSADGVLWWELETWPGMKRPYGDERKIAAWLAFNLEVGETFTMKQLRAVLGDQIVPNDKEHLNRRLRSLREERWSLLSKRDDGSLGVDEYRVSAIGWHPGSDVERSPRHEISDRIRRQVIERDGRRCVVCGVGAGEPYVDEPNSAAVLTAGHRTSRSRDGRVDPDNLQAECSRCNEPIRDRLVSYESLEELMPDLQALNREGKTKLEAWLLGGHRTRDQVDDLYDKLRRLPPSSQAHAEVLLRRMLGNR